MIVKETERAEEKKEKKKKKQKQIIKKRNDGKNIEIGSPNVASEMSWRCPLLSFFFNRCYAKIVRCRKASVPK